MTRKYRPSETELKLAKFQFGYKERSDLYHQLIALLETGMSKTDAIRMSWDVASMEGKKPKEMTAIVLDDVIRSMENGNTLATALRRWVPAEDVMIFEAIESTQNFSGNLQNYMELLEKKRGIKSTIVGGMAYPALLFAMVYGIMIYFGSTVVPTISQMLPMESWTGPASFLRFMYNFSQTMAVPFLLTVLLIFGVIYALLPRWKGMGRIFADKFPIFSTYRMYTGISFLMSMASLLQSGMHATDALNRLHPRAEPYVKSRILLVRNQLLNGANFGAALYRAKTGWPDTKMNLNIKIFSETQDLSAQLSRLARTWIDQSQKNIEKTMGLLRTAAMLMVFGVILGIVGGIFSLQDQIATSVNQPM